MAYKYIGERYVCQASWGDSPHLSEDAKASLLSSLPEWQRDARSKGIPQLGEGAVFQMSQDQYVIPVLRKGVPPHWPRSYGLDVGVRTTAAVWMARDPDTGIYYVYQEYSRDDAPYSIHAAAIKDRGDWVQGTVDPASDQRNASDGQRLIDNYRRAGLHLIEAENSVNSGLDSLCDALAAGNLKIFETCYVLLRQMRLYRRVKSKTGDKVAILKKDDHAVDALRYEWVSGRDVMKVRPKATAMRAPQFANSGRAWMA